MRSASDAWAAGAAGSSRILRRYNGSTWADLSPSGTGSLEAAWAADSCNAWAVGSGGAIYHFGVP